MQLSGSTNFPIEPVEQNISPFAPTEQKTWKTGGKSSSDKNTVAYIMCIKELNPTVQIISEIKDNNSKFLFKKA
jgi:hypothetical protein